MARFARRGNTILGVEYCLFDCGLPEPPADKRRTPHFLCAGYLTALAQRHKEIREQSRPPVLRFIRGILVLRTEETPGHRTLTGSLFFIVGREDMTRSRVWGEKTKPKPRVKESFGHT